MSEQNADIGATRLGGLVVGVLVFGVGLGAFVSFLQAEESQKNAQDRAVESEGVERETSANSDKQSAVQPGSIGVDALAAVGEWSEAAAAVDAAGRAVSSAGTIEPMAAQTAEVVSSANQVGERTGESGEDGAVIATSSAKTEAGTTADESDRKRVSALDSDESEPRAVNVEESPVAAPSDLAQTSSTKRGNDGGESGTSEQTLSREVAESRGARAPSLGADATVYGAGDGDNSGASGGESKGETDEKGDEDEGFTAKKVAQRIQAFYRETDDFKSSFKQVYRDVAAGEEKIRWGKVYFKTPGKMRWDYYDTESRDDRTKTLVSNGDFLWVYELEFQQVFKECLSEKQLPTSLKFLMGEGDLLEDFDVSFTEESSREAPELELVPKEPTPKYKKLHFRVDSDAEQVTETTVFDPYGNTNTIHFQDVTLNSNLPDSGFEFEPPEDARLLKENVDCD